MAVEFEPLADGLTEDFGDELNARFSALKAGVNDAYQFRGVWNSATAYSANDGVSYGGSTWVALLANTNIAPVAGATWAVIGTTTSLGGAGGVLSGSFPNPGFAVDMATQAELDAVAAAKANVSHTHTSSSITDFTEAVQDAVASALVAGSGQSITYDDVANTITFTNSAPLTQEAVEDIVGAMALAGTGISVAYDDATGKLTFTNTAPESGGGLTQENVEDIVASLLVQGTNVTLSYNDATGQLTVSAAGGGASSLDSLTDAAVSTPIVRDGLFYDGANFVNRKPAMLDFEAGDREDGVFEALANILEDSASVEWVAGSTPGRAKAQLVSAPASFSNDLLPWLIDIDVFMTPVSQIGYTQRGFSGMAYGGYILNSVQNDEISFDIVFGAGTWAFEVMGYPNSAAGIMTLSLDAIDIGTLDWYASPNQDYNTRKTISSIVTATAAKRRLRIKMATKNASASGYLGYLQHIQLRRTA